MENKLEIHTLISHKGDGSCCGCLNGYIDKERDSIEFKCNECGEDVGYISLSYLQSILSELGSINDISNPLTNKN